MLAGSGCTRRSRDGYDPASAHLAVEQPTRESSAGSDPGANRPAETAVLAQRLLAMKQAQCVAVGIAKKGDAAAALDSDSVKSDTPFAWSLTGRFEITDRQSDTSEGRIAEVLRRPGVAVGPDDPERSPQLPSETLSRTLPEK